MTEKRPVLLSLIASRITGLILLAPPTRLVPLTACLVLILALLSAPMAHAQGQVPVSHMPFPQPIGQSVGGGLDDRAGEPDEIDAARRARALNDMRQKEIISDTNKLLKLANDLDAEIRKANSDSLTPEQLHKLATIEKLARNVKEHMSTPVIGLPVYHPPPAPVMH
jgi:hypothetical protein